MSFNKIIEKYRKISFSEADKGQRFERLMQAYLQTDPQYSYKFKNVWLWEEFPGRDDLGGIDTGIDLVALTHSGDYWAIQCKCYQKDTTIDKPKVDGFLSTSSKEFKDENNQMVRFSQRLWISTTNKWGPNASEAIKNQNPPVARINLSNLISAPIDWEKLDKGIHGEESRTPKKILRKHQKEALEKTNEYLKSKDRGQLIMACGTGKTFTTLRIAENETDSKGLILFLVPSIALLGQALREWSSDAKEPINAICICSDPEISKRKTKNPDKDSFSTVDLAMPASTDTDNILRQFQHIKDNKSSGMTVVFSTYQSIEVISKAQKVLMDKGFKEFDLIICDEAHRTTGVTLADEDESAFVKVHDNEFIKSKKRIYMTATPRLYSDEAKSKAAKSEAILCSMDDPEQYGEEMYRIGFGKAVSKNLLTDYKVLILTLSENEISPAIQHMIADNESEISTDDASKLIGCINALSKQFIGDKEKTIKSDPEPMRRAVAFCQRIKVSKQITKTFNTSADSYLNSLPPEKKKQMVSIASDHMDGTMSAPKRDEILDWLKAPTENNECRILTNVRVLSEGVDVPALDAVMFLSAKNSPIDVVQSVGRVMRKHPDKKYGYIIIPVFVPSDVKADVALDDNKRFKVVWTVLNALRAHDERFNAMVNQIKLNKKLPSQILVGRPDVTFDHDGNPRVAEDDAEYGVTDGVMKQMELQFEKLQPLIYAKMVEKVGDRRYWEQWATDVADIAERHILRITKLISEKNEQREAFDNFLTGLRNNINPSINESEAIEMLAQHIITKPIFEALFNDYSFVKNNAVSSTMQKMLDSLEEDTLSKDAETLQRFYESVKIRASGIDNAEGRQSIIIELYNKFFKTAFPRMVERLGIVYTPVEIVDFIIHSVNDVLKSEFGRNISDENIQILDPFTGTGTFITRLIQSGLIEKKDLERKYKKEIHANEIVLLAYYIAAVNIENAYHEQMGEDSEYEPFEGIVLTDTFQLGEAPSSERKKSTNMFIKNTAKVENQKKAPLRVIMGNPPYSIGQKSANDNAQNQKYDWLDARIAATYVKASSAGLTRSLYDAYIKAFRWSTDRLDPEHGGVIAFVSNGSWLDGNSTDGFRKVIETEFSSIWVFNLRGNQRTSGELSQREGGKVFGSGSRTPISITLLVKNPKSKNRKAKIKYHDIGDYHTREEKLTIANEFNSVDNPKMEWESLKPNKQGDWLNQRTDLFENLIPLVPKKKFDLNNQSFFNTNAVGVVSSRDAWVYNFSSKDLSENILKTIDFYNYQIKKIKKAIKNDSSISFVDLIEFDRKKISWSVKLKNCLLRGDSISYKKEKIILGLYRPYTKQLLYFDNSLIERPGINLKLFPNLSLKNRAINCHGLGGNKSHSVLLTENIIDFNSLEAGSQCFPLNYYEKQEEQLSFDSIGKSKFIRRDGISDFIFGRAKKQYGKNVSKEDIFYYVYGILHNPEYRATFANDLKKMLPRLPLVDDVKDFWKFSKAGRQLADLHIEYESVPAYDGVQVDGLDSGSFKVEKMKFPKIDGEVRGKKKKVNDKSTIIFNNRITISNIPEKAYKYIVNGKSAIEWIMDRYQIKTHKASGITNNPNDWAEEVGNPRYILDLLLSIINVSVQTVDIVDGLPKLTFD